MQPRPRFPMQGGMGQGMMSPGQGLFGGGNPMMGQSSGPFGGRSPMMGPSSGPFEGRSPMMGGQQMGRGGGGFLSRLLGRGNPAGGAAGGLRGMQGMQGMQGLGAGRAATGGGGGILQSMSNPSGIMGFLNNTQQVLKTAQSIGPMIQQYGPLVKNLPAMWKLYRGLKMHRIARKRPQIKRLKKKKNVQRNHPVPKKSALIQKLKEQIQKEQQSEHKQQGKKTTKNQSQYLKIKKRKVLLFQNYTFKKNADNSILFKFV